MCKMCSEINARSLCNIGKLVFSRATGRLPSVGGFHLYAACMARMPKPIRPPNIMDTLLAVQDRMREHGHTQIAEDIGAVRDALRTMLDLTSAGDVLFADEIRNILNIRHNLPARRGTDTDPMAVDRLIRRMRGK
jgi:hypothetical protein